MAAYAAYSFPTATLAGRVEKKHATYPGNLINDMLLTLSDHPLTPTCQWDNPTMFQFVSISVQNWHVYCRSLVGQQPSCSSLCLLFLSSAVANQLLVT